MILETFDKELHEKTLRKEGYDSGYDTGFTAGYEDGIRRLAETLSEFGLDKTAIIAKLVEKCGISPADAEKLLEQNNK